MDAITAGTKVRIEKGCKAREVPKGLSATVESVTNLGADYGHSVRVVLKFRNGFIAGKTLVLYARHENRLSDALINLNDGNPLHKIVVKRV